MLLKSSVVRIAFVVMLVAACTQTSWAQQAAFNKEEFAARRAKLFEQIPDGIAIIAAAPTQVHPVKFRQAPDFFYFTGIEEPEDILVMVGPTKKTYVYSEKREGANLRSNGPTLLNDENSAKTYGVDGVLPLQEFSTNFALQGRLVKKLYVPLTPQDILQLARFEVVFTDINEQEHPLTGHTPPGRAAIEKLHRMHPELDLVDVSTLIDRLRHVKTPYEIERMRKAGKIGADSVAEGMRGTRPGMYEYEIEAAARYVTFVNGAQVAFTPIVASAENRMTWHYERNDRQMQAGDVVLMDYGADYDHYTSDITRTWPVSGKFTPEQEKMYQCVYETSQAIIAAIKPGVTTTQLKAIGREVFKKHGFEKEWMDLGEYIGHPVGMSVHDVGPGMGGVGGAPITLVAGATFNVEPILHIEDRKIHIRLEDSILVTETGHENLTAAVPAELNAVYALIKEKGINSK
jgi:Xaa-Pro aminopeptidase